MVINCAQLSLSNILLRSLSIHSLDVVALPSTSSPTDEQNLLHVYTWSHDEWTFRKNSTIQSPNGGRIINVTPGDFTHSGRLDLLVMTDGGTKLQGFLFEGRGVGGFGEPSLYLTRNDPDYDHLEPSSIAIPPSTLAQPIPLDYNGNMRLDMIGNVPPTGSTPTDQDNALTIWKNVWDQTNGQILFDTVPFASSNNSTTSAPKCQLPNPHSSAIVDFNGDCLADLFLICKDPSSSDRTTYQIWLNDPNGGYTLAREGAMPKGSGMVSFGDMGIYFPF